VENEEQGQLHLHAISSASGNQTIDLTGDSEDEANNPSITPEGASLKDQMLDDLYKKLNETHDAKLALQDKCGGKEESLSQKDKYWLRMHKEKEKELQKQVNDMENNADSIPPSQQRMAEEPKTHAESSTACGSVISQHEVTNEVIVTQPDDDMQPGIPETDHTGEPSNQDDASGVQDDLELPELPKKKGKFKNAREFWGRAGIIKRRAHLRSLKRDRDADEKTKGRRQKTTQKKQGQKLDDMNLFDSVNLKQETPKQQKDRAERERKHLHSVVTQGHFGDGRCVEAKDDKGRTCYKLEGMKTLVYGYQLVNIDWIMKQECLPEDPYGGILADGMGLGKTIQMIAAMTQNPPLPKDYEPFIQIGNNPGQNLLICPKAAVMQWKLEIEAHAEDLSVHLYQSGLSTETVVRKNDVV
jgi:SNF2 family DNA or RNA helicase